jgi:hypothetical protein
MRRRHQIGDPHREQDADQAEQPRTTRSSSILLLVEPKAVCPEAIASGVSIKKLLVEPREFTI